MNGPDRLPDWPQVRAHFERLAEMAPQARVAALQELAERDADLAHEVASLLDHAAEADRAGFDDSLRSISSGALRAALGEAELERLSSDGRVGPYEVERQIGRGGTGSVFLARRVDGAYEGRVAIKVLRRGLDTEDLLARFRAERQILASLTHPRIARLLDGGALEDGRPYLVMEHVDGRPIDRHCDEEGCTLRERLELFLQVCDAVAHAHGELVLHRDLKPSNVLVDSAGSVSLLDFGIARVLDPQRLPGEPARTRTGHRLFTPDYASPEQVRGEGAGIASDVYQLGVLLCRLLTGESPYAVEEGASIADLQRAITEGRVRPPSRIAREAGDRARERRLRGDLDTIALKALRTEPEGRYRTADALAADIRAHLAGFPVSARPATIGYQAGRFIRRNPAAVATAAAAALLLVVLTAVSVSWAASTRAYSHDLAVERDRAEREAQTADEVTSYLISLFQASDPAEHGGEQLSARTLLDRGVRRAEMLEATPDRRATLLSAMGEVHMSLHAFEEAEGLFRQALALHREGGAEASAEIADELNRIGHAVRRGGDRDRGMEYYQRALEMRRALFGDVHPDVACSLNNVALVLDSRGEYDEAIAHFEEALAMRERFVGRESDCIATILRNVGETYRTVGDLEMARLRVQESMNIYERLGQTSTPGYATAVRYMATLERRAERYDEAERLHRQALALNQRLHGEDALPVATNWNDLGVLLNSAGRYEGAVEAHREALRIRAAAQGAESRGAGNSLTNLSAALLNAGRLEEAEEVSARAVAITRETRGEDDLWHASALHWRGSILMEMGRLEGAESDLRRALAIREMRMGRDDDRYAQTSEVLEELARRRTL
jgi:eukaryotic-like serine/threonine-protein kinase